MNKECLKCKKEFNAVRESAKFCSTSCRVMYNRKHGSVAKLTKIQKDTAFNALMEKINRVNFSPINNSAYEGKVEDKLKSDEIAMWPNNENEITFQDLLNGMAGLQFPDDKEEYARKIKGATHLPDKQIKLLLTNLWT